MPGNTRPCGTCRHLDPEPMRTNEATHHYCWAFYVWRTPGETVVDCDKATRANGEEPPAKIHFAGRRANR